MGRRVLHEVYSQKIRVGPSWKSSTTPPTVAGPHQPSSCPCPCGSMRGTALGRARATRLLVSWTRPTSARRARVGRHNQTRSQRFEPAALSAFNAHERLESRDLSRQARPIPASTTTVTALHCSRRVDSDLLRLLLGCHCGRDPEQAVSVLRLDRVWIDGRRERDQPE